MQHFYAVMINPQGFTFVVRFMSSGWYKIEDDVWNAYDKVKSDHEKYGPWSISKVDVGY